ncbi:hypothetical protein QJS10_CPA09g00976 [Acorus calamus]|uniref:RNase H type-1 domain-containing protein n=1 Tax=Acorus calamus TaxID=4465 RepID=A0AAV9E3J6_ACOCL|nr:hypothetical protein QJS10_CPA09g00976 [Acorus calamus]
MQVIWSRPLTDWVKINSDGSLGDDRNFFGVVVRDAQGDCFFAMAARTRAASINILELQGILASLLLCKGFHTKVWSETDSSMVLGTGTIPWTTFEYLREIKEIVNSFNEWKITHVYREGNRVVDALAALQFQMGFTIFSSS